MIYFSSQRLKKEGDLFTLQRGSVAKEIVVSKDFNPSVSNISFPICFESVSGMLIFCFLNDVLSFPPNV